MRNNLHPTSHLLTFDSANNKSVRFGSSADPAVRCDEVQTDVVVAVDYLAVPSYSHLVQLCAKISVSWVRIVVKVFVEGGRLWNIGLGDGGWGRC